MSCMKIEIWSEEQQRDIINIHSTKGQAGSPDESVYELLKEFKDGTKEVSKEEVIERLMIPMIIETARCLEEDIVATHRMIWV